MSRRFAVNIATEETPLVDKTVEILSRIVSERTGIEVVRDNSIQAALTLDIQPGIGKEGFEIGDDADRRRSGPGNCR